MGQALKGKVAIITGASRGIGKATAVAYAREGAKVVVAARSETESPKIAGTIHATAALVREAGGEALAVRCDVTDEEQVEAMVRQAMEAFGRVDVLVNNAGANIMGDITELTPKRWDLGLRVNLRGPFLAMKFALPHMMKQRSGSIINLSSWMAHAILPEVTNYVIAKVAVERLTAIVAKQGAEYGIAANCFDPHLILTEGILYALPKDTDFSEYRRPEAVEAPMVWLARQSAATFTGRTLRIADWDRGATGDAPMLL